MTVQNTLYINNIWKQGRGNSFVSRNSATRQFIWQGFAASEKDVNEAILAARNAFETWGATTFEERVVFLERYSSILKESQDQLAEAISKEVGKPLWEAKSEVSAMVNKVSISIEAYQKRCHSFERDHPAGKAITIHKPHGVMAILGPFNFPGHIPNGHIIPALLAGNTVVFKPSEMTPMVGELMIRHWEKSKLPPGVINLVQGGRETGQFLVRHREINGLLFTGSWSTGLILLESFARTPEKILALELGGNNPLIFDDVADIKAAAYATIQSAFLTSGQRCSCTRRLIVKLGKHGDEFINTLFEMTKRIKVGNYNDQPEPFMGPVISEHAASHLIAVQDALIKKGGRPLVHMNLKAVDTALLTPGIIDVTEIHAPDEEIFGPLLQVCRVENLDEAIQAANNTVYGLTAGLLSDSRENFQKFFQKIKAGVVSWNAPTTGSSSGAPFGGIKRSGNFRPSGFYAADYCSYPVAIIEGSTLTMPDKLLPGIT